MKNTPYIYIVLFLSLVHPIFAQSNRILKLSGTESYSDEIIQQIGYKKNCIQDSLCVKEIKQFRKKLNQLGFIDHTIDSVSINDSIYSVRFNLKKVLNKIRITYPDLPLLALITNYKINKDKTAIEIPFVEFSSFINQISDYFQNNGFPFVTIQFTTLSKKGDFLSGILLIHKKKKRSIDKIIVKGYVNFPKAFINRKFNLHVGDLYSNDKIQQISEACNAIDFVSEIKSPELLFTKDSTALYLYLKREKSNYFDGLVGFSSSKEKKGLQLYGNINLKINNALNTGESMELKWLSNQNKAKTLNLSVKTPYVLKTAFSIYYNLSIHKQDTLYARLSNLLNIDYNISKNQNIGFLIEQSQSNKISISEQNLSKNFHSLFYGSTYTYKKLNNHSLFTTKFFLNSQISQGIRNGFTQYKFTNKAQYLFTIDHKNNILLKNTTQFLFSKNYIENELFRIGGSQSIRGFEEDRFQSTGFTYINMAYNYLIKDTSFLSGMLDLGLVNNKLTHYTYYLYSVGIGFSQKTKMGQLGIQYFIGNTVKDPFSFSNSKLHISIAQNF